MWKFFRKFIKKIKGPWPETSTGARMNPRTSLICGGLALVVMGLAAARVTYSLYDIQIKNGDTYRQLAAKQQLLDTTIKATRGEIYDTSGITLASTSVVWTIWADPDNSKILYTTTGKDEETVRTLDTAMCAEVSRELTLRLLSGDGESLDAVDTSSEAYQTQYQKVYDALSKTDTKYQVLATKVNNAVKLSIESYVSQFNKAHKRATETSRKGNISVGSEKSFQRNYPYGAFAAAVLGFTDADGIGTYGLEKSYQSTLAGVDGRTITQRNAYGNAIADENATTFAAKDGSNLVLSLDVNVQEIVERYLNEEGDYSGYFRDIQWKNKAITELYYPGSVFKVITSAMGVDSGLANINTTFTCAGAYGVAKETYHCAGHKAHGTITLAEALRQSCNIYYIQLGQRVGSQTFYNYFDAFGFTSRTGVDLPSETGFMQYYKANQLGEVQLASSAFGQAMAITPLQMCTAVAAAVNGGYLVTPHVVDKITDANGNVIEEIGANVRRQVISESTSNVIRQIMEYEVGAGTGGGKYAYVSGYRIGGKSGTSEQLNMDRRADGDYKKVASFAAVLPADDPEIIVYVMLDDPNNARTDYSSLLAAPVVGNIISEIAPYLGIAADGEDRSQTVVTVPNLVGTEWSSAQVQLNIKGLRHQLAESTTSQAAAAVTYQYPHAGAKVAYGTTVYLYTDTYEGSHTDVPDVTGKSADFARQMLSAAGLNCVVEGNANGTVQAQSADPGSSVQRGTVVTITCG